MLQDLPVGYPIPPFRPIEVFQFGGPALRDWDPAVVHPGPPSPAGPFWYPAFGKIKVEESTVGFPQSAVGNVLRVGGCVKKNTAVLRFSLRLF